MRILTVVHNFPPEFTGGTERAAELLSLELAERGHEVRVFCGTPQLRPEPGVVEEDHRGLKVLRFFRSEDYRSPIDLYDPYCEDEFEKVVREFAPDVVHLHHWVHLSTGLLGIAARCGVPSVVTLHDYWTTCSLIWRLPDDDDFCEKVEGMENCLPCLRQRRPIEEGELVHTLDMRLKSVMSELLCTGTILISGGRQLENIARLGRFPREVFEKVQLLPIGVVPPQFVSDAQVEPKRSDTVTIGHWGNLSRVKGVDVLAQAAARSSQAKRLKLKLIGDSKDTNLLDGLQESAGLATIELLGRYDAGALPELIKDVDVAVFPSLCEETHSIVLDEALLAGLPVIVSDRGAMAARVGDRGLIVPANDVDALAEALDVMADDDQRFGFATGAFGDVVDTKTYAGQVEEIYLGLKSPSDRAHIPDLGRERLAYRSRRFSDVGRFALDQEEQRRKIEAAVMGDRQALSELKMTNAALAAQIESLLGNMRDD